MAITHDKTDHHSKLKRHIQQAHTANEGNKLRYETREIFEINVKRHISYYIDKAYFNSFTVHD